MNNPEFRSAVQRPAAEIDLAQAALLYARDAYPDLDPARYLVCKSQAKARVILSGL